jgi:hypothetical protein
MDITVTPPGHKKGPVVQDQPFALSVLTCKTNIKVHKQ